LLLQKGYDVGILSRSPKTGADIKNYFWNPYTKEIDKNALHEVEYIIHLAGANVFKEKWSAAGKKRIIDSRVQSALFLFDEIQKRKIPLKAFISASAVGYYGTEKSENIYKETDLPGNGFLAETCKQWESAADRSYTICPRVVKFRTGIVLSREGGAMEKMMFSAKNGLAVAFGNGKQFFPWIHISDLCNMYIKAIEDSRMNGVYNAVAPDFKTNKEFVQALTSAFKRKVWLPNIPVFILKMLLGERSEMLLTGNKISADKILNEGFCFAYPYLLEALNDLTAVILNPTDFKKKS
jgi:hypothetical protein